MADHLSFAVARAQRGPHRDASAYEVRETYPKEYKAAQFIVMRLEKELGERLPRMRLPVLR
ncbi:MAG: PRD domain-containing protein [Collinsella aerofaciens]